MNNFPTYEEFINFFRSTEYLNYMPKLTESNDKEKMSEFETVKNKKTNELFKKRGGIK
ncbi:MAG: hypothetical protein ACYDDE_06990 [bacterium]